MSHTTTTCRTCTHFVHDPRTLEQLLPGLTILSSAQGESWGDQGLCEVYAQMLTPQMTCPRFESCEERVYPSADLMRP